MYVYIFIYVGLNELYAHITILACLQHTYAHYIYIYIVDCAQLWQAVVLSVNPLFAYTFAVEMRFRNHIKAKICGKHCLLHDNYSYMYICISMHTYVVKLHYCGRCCVVVVLISFNQQI